MSKFKYYYRIGAVIIFTPVLLLTAATTAITYNVFNSETEEITVEVIAPVQIIGPSVLPETTARPLPARVPTAKTIKDTVKKVAAELDTAK